MATNALTGIRTDLAYRLEEAAALMQRPRIEIVEEALANWLDTEDWRDRRTRAAMASADAGDVVDHDRVAEWVRSLGTASPLPRPQPLK